jgi:hypothetical protein
MRPLRLQGPESKEGVSRWSLARFAHSRNAAQPLQRKSKDLIGESVIRVGKGAKLVTDAGDILHEITDSAKRVGLIVTEIATASEDAEQRHRTG